MPWHNRQFRVLLQPSRQMEVWLQMRLLRIAPRKSKRWIQVVQLLRMDHSQVRRKSRNSQKKEMRCKRTSRKMTMRAMKMMLLMT